MSQTHRETGWIVTRQENVEQILQPLESALQQVRSDVGQLAEENRLLLEQLATVQGELEQLHLLRGWPDYCQPGPGGWHGADERVKRQLTYRLGAVVVRASTPLAYLKLPFSLMREARRYRYDRQARQGEQLPPIEQYADAYKADQARRHLSWRLGEQVMACSRSPLGWLRLPVALSREYRAYRRERQR